MNIGILGCGYVGQALASYWKNQGHQVTVTTRQTQRIPLLQTVAHHVYLLDSSSLADFMASQQILLISVAPASSSDYASTYLQTAQQVAQHVKGSCLQHILYTSSTSVYGDHAGEWVDETTPLTSRNENSRILSETEQVLLSCATKDLKVCIVRLGEIYGPGREIEQRLHRMQHQPFAGTGASYTNLIHLTDIVYALDFALQHRLQGIYNLCSDFHVPRHHFYQEICQREQLPPIQWDPQRTSLHGGNRRVSNQKLKDEGFTLTHPTYFSS